MIFHTVSDSIDLSSSSLRTPMSGQCPIQNKCCFCIIRRNEALALAGVEHGTVSRCLVFFFIGYVVPIGASLSGFFVACLPTSESTAACGAPCSAIRLAEISECAASSQRHDCKCKRDFPHFFLVHYGKFSHTCSLSELEMKTAPEGAVFIRSCFLKFN